MFTSEEYDHIHALVFNPGYPGYKPSVVEIPNGDGKRDEAKKYAHVALKYFRTADQARTLSPYLYRAHEVAFAAAKSAGVPDHLLPDLRYGAMRVLDYPPEAVSNFHCDFDLFTLMCFRDQPDKFVAYDSDQFGPQMVREIRKYNPQAHLGEIAEVEHLGKATGHEVLPSTTRQRSIVYFAIPDHDSVLSTGVTVRDWLNERMQRSRTEFRKYE